MVVGNRLPTCNTSTKIVDQKTQRRFQKSNVKQCLTNSFANKTQKSNMCKGHIVPLVAEERTHLQMVVSSTKSTQKSQTQSTEPVILTQNKFPPLQNLLGNEHNDTLVQQDPEYIQELPQITHMITSKQESQVCYKVKQQPKSHSHNCNAHNDAVPSAIYDQIVIS